MPEYRYHARDLQGQARLGTLRAVDAAAAADSLTASGLIPVDIQPVRPANRILDRLQALRRPVRPEQLLLFYRQMASMIKAGVPMLETMASLTKAHASTPFARVLDDVREQLMAGHALAAACSRHPRAFDPLMLHLIHLGESTGRLQEVFQRLHEHLLFDREMAERVRAALRYPAFVLVALVVAVAVINFMVVPAFAKVYQNAGADLPLMTRILIASSEFSLAYWPWLLAAAMLAVGGVRIWLASKRGRETWDRFVLHLPVFGAIVHKAALARFARALAMAYGSGLSILDSLGTVAQAMDNRHLAQRLAGLASDIQRGTSLSAAAAGTGVFTPEVLQMLAIGEQTGDLERLLEDVGGMYQREVEYALRGLSQYIEPLLIAVLAGVVLVLALGVFLPVWDMAQTMLRPH